MVSAHQDLSAGRSDMLSEDTCVFHTADAELHGTQFLLLCSWLIVSGIMLPPKNAAAV